MKSLVIRFLLKSLFKSFIIKWLGYFKSIFILVLLLKLILTIFDILIFSSSSSNMSHIPILKLTKIENACPIVICLLQSNIN